VIVCVSVFSLAGRFTTGWMGGWPGGWRGRRMSSHSFFLSLKEHNFIVLLTGYYNHTQPVLLFLYNKSVISN
jgi:hypothetical protein